MGLPSNHEDSDTSEVTNSSTTQSNTTTPATSVDSIRSPPAKNLPFDHSQHNTGKKMPSTGIDDPQFEDSSTLDDQKPKFRAPGLIYRDEYRYGDGELAKSEEKEDESELSSRNNQGDTSDVVLKIVTTYKSSSAEKASNEKQQSTDATSDVKKTSSVPEGFKRSSVASRKITIFSMKLINALRDVISYYPGSTLLGEEVDVEEPYCMLVHYKAELLAYKDEHPSCHAPYYREECNRHIDLLLNFLEWHSGKALRDEMDRWTRDVPVCTFENLWLLFKPGESGYRLREPGQYDPFITKVVAGGLESNKLDFYDIDIWNISFNGFMVGRTTMNGFIEPFDGEKEIRSLRLFPERFYFEDERVKQHHGNKPLRERLIARGKTFWDLVKQRSCYREYNGKSAEPPYNQIQSRVVIDPSSFYEYTRDTMEKDDPDPEPVLDGEDKESVGESGLMGCACQACIKQPSKHRLGKFQAYHEIVPSKQQPPHDDDFFFLCDHKINGMVLNTRKWETLNVDCLMDTDFQANAFDKLVLPLDVKNTLEAISCSYARAKDNSKRLDADLIKGKGEGKIFLLHGPPGTGKTLSAEVVAELTERPLLSLTCGDLGTTAVEVEKNLSRYMGYGELWGAVVLLDEADIYLQARNLFEVERNSLVSVFLRALEYYRGLLFLTTNRVNTFDEAFKSRIHVALEYKKLSNEDRETIWLNSMEKMDSARVRVMKSARDYVCTDPEVLSLEWNGREIRNSLQTALSLAEFQAEKEKKEVVTIKTAHLRQVVKLSASFKKYIASMHRNQTDSQIAKKEGLRNDSYADPPSRPQRKDMYRDRYEEGEQDGVHVSRTKTRDRRKAAEYEYVEEDERPRAQGKRTAKKPSRPVEDDDEEEEEEKEEEEGRETRAPATARGKVVTEHSEDEDGEPKAKNRYTKSALPLNDRDDDEGSDARPSKLATRSTKPYPRAHNANHADTLAHQARTTNSRRNGRQVYEDDEEEEE